MCKHCIYCIDASWIGSFEHQSSEPWNYCTGNSIIGDAIMQDAIKPILYIVCILQVVLVCNAYNRDTNDVILLIKKYTIPCVKPDALQ